MNNYRRFKVFPIKGVKDYYVVYIFKNRQEMRLASFQMSNNKGSLKSEAVTLSYKAYDKGKRTLSHNIGSIMFYKDGFGAGVVAHEIAHAVNYYFLRKKICFNVAGKRDKKWQKNDERYAWMLGYMVNQFWKKYYKKPKKERY